MNEGDNPKKPWWQTLPVILTGITGVIGAIAALLVAFQPIMSWFDSKNKLRDFDVDAKANCTTPFQHNNMYQTGIKFQKGDSIDIKANDGEWWSSIGDKYNDKIPDSEKRKGGANGIEWSNLAGIHVGSLVGRIGTGRVFFLGKHYQEITDSSGELYLGYWDDYCDDNAGAVRVTVSIIK